jgi:hypothetical protein
MRTSDEWKESLPNSTRPPDNVSYIVLRLADDSFVHVSFHDHGDDEVNPIASTAAFAHFSTATLIVERVPSTNRPQRWWVPTSRRSTDAETGA